MPLEVSKWGEVLNAWTFAERGLFGYPVEPPAAPKAAPAAAARAAKAGKAHTTADEDLDDPWADEGPRRKGRKGKRG